MAGKSQIAVTKPELNASVAMDRVKSFWSGLRPQQRVYLGVGLAIALSATVFLVNLITTPDFKPLMSGLDPADAQAIGAQMAAKKIPYLVSTDGTSISVAADQVDAARLEIASNDPVHSGRIGFEIFDKVSWGETEFDEKVNYQRALEGELERTIQTVKNVKRARVHLVMAAVSIFIDRERGAKASVTLQLKGGSLSKRELSAISRLVAGSVDDLNPSDVVIIDADSNEFLAQPGSVSDESDGLEQQLTSRLISTLTPIVGTDHIHASVNVEYETGSSEENQEKYDPTVSATLTMQHSEDGAGSGESIGGVPGTASNLPTAKSSASRVAAKVDPGQYSRSDSNTYGVNRITRHVVEPAGSIRRLTAAVLLDDVIVRHEENGKWVETHQKRNPEELKVIGDLAQAAIGFNASRGDVISVENLAFDRPTSADLPPVSLSEQATNALRDYSSIVRYLGILALILLVYMLMIRPIQKRIFAIQSPEWTAKLAQEQHELQVGVTSETISAAQRNLMLKKQVTDFVRAEPESSATAVRAWLHEAVE